MTSPSPLTGEPLALDLINTRPRLADGPCDLLAAPRDLLAWLTLEAGRLAPFTEEEAARLTRDDLAPIHAVRDHARDAIECLRRGEAPPEAAIRGLNEAMGAAPPIRELLWHGGTLHEEVRREGPPTVRLAARLAEAAAELLADPAISTVRQCEADDCVMLFLPTHPRRRWCSAKRCGNRARVARYYQRHKGA